MTKFIDIDQIDVLEKNKRVPLYVMIAGGMGAGKSYIIEQKIHSICLLDVDKIMIKLGFLEYTREQFNEAMKQISLLFDHYMAAQTSVIAMGTASTVSTAIDRLYGAKMMGYDTILVYIDAPVEQAISQNRERIKNGYRGVSKADEHKIERTSIGAANTVAVLRETTLVDYFVYYNNTRSKGLN